MLNAHSAYRGARLFVIIGFLMGTQHLQVQAKPLEKDIANRITRIARTHGAILSYGDVSKTDEGVSIKNIRAKLKENGNKTDGDVITIESVMLENAKLTTKYGIKAEKVIAQNVSASAMGKKFMFGQGVFEKTTLFGLSSRKNKKTLTLYSMLRNFLPTSYHKVELRDIVIDTQEETTLPIASIILENSDFIDNQPREIKVTIKDMILEAETSQKPLKEFMKSLGYDKISASFNVNLRWDDIEKQLYIKRIELSAPQIGSMNFSLQLSTIDRTFFSNIEKQPLLDIIQTTPIKSFTLKFNNDSIIERLIKKQADEKGMTTANVIDGLVETLPLMLSDLKGEMSEKAKTALTSFLSSPHNLEISIQAKQAIPFDKISKMTDEKQKSDIEIDIRANQ